MSSVIDQGVGGLQRRHAVVLHADIADYSRLMADDGAGTVATVRAYQQLVSTTVGDVGGTLINFVGDSFLAVFDDAHTAMRAAVTICEAVRQHNHDLPDHRRTWFRLGLDAGEIVVADDGRYFGDTLNIAARIQAIAEAGGINVTEAVYVELDEPALRLIGIGARRLKNIPEMVRVYRLAGVGTDTQAARKPAAEPTLGVLPTTFVGADSATIGDALRLELIRTLMRIPGLRVIETGADDRAFETDARYLLESGVVRSGRALRAYVQLLDALTMNRVWSDRWEGSDDDLFALQDAVSAGTARAMEIELVVGQPALIYRAELDAEDLEAIYRGWHQLTRGTRDSWRTAARLFTGVADRWPDKVAGHALVAFVRWWGTVQGLSDDPETDLRDATAHAERGAAIGDPSGLSQMVLAAIKVHGDGDAGAVLGDAEAALRQRPTCDVSYGVLGSVQRYVGDWHAAVEACQRAQDLSPLPKPWYGAVLASAYYVGQRYHEAIDAAEQTIAHRPHDLEALLVLAAAQQALGLRRRARATAATIIDAHPQTRRADLVAQHPFRDADVIDRWVRHLAEAGVP